MSDTSLVTALEAISLKSNEGARKQGAEDFKEELQKFEKSGGLPNETCRHIVLTLGRRIQSTRLDFDKSKAVDNANSNRGKARKNLAVFASLFRHVVIAGARRMRHKTVKLVLDCILEIIANRSSSFFGPVCHEYTRCLRVVLDFTPHVEHLDLATWNDIAQVCINIISELSPAPQYSNGHGGTPSSGTPRPATPMELESTARSEVVNGSQRQSVDTYGVGDDLVACIRNLVCAPNARVSNLAEPILSTLTEWLSNKRSIQFQVEAFAAINAVILKIHVDSTALVQQTISRLIPLVKTLWSTKLTALKDEMLITLISTKAHAAHMLSLPDGQFADFRSDIVSLVEIIGNDSVKRGEREQLQMDEIRLRCEHDLPREQTPFILPAFQLKQGNLRSEQNWAKLYLTAFYSNMLDSSRPKRAESSVNENKRLRGLDHFEDYIRQTSSPQRTTRIHALQVASFMVQQMGHDVEAVRVMLERFTAQNSDATADNWAMLGIAACAMQAVSECSGLQSLWAAAWQFSARNLAVASSSRAAAHLMDVILRRGLVESSTRLETINTIISSAELNGPANLDEAAASLWVSIFDVRSAESPHSLDVDRERIVRWLFSKWDPCQSNGRSRVSLNYDVWDIMRVLCSAMDRPVPLNEQHSFSNLGPVALSWLRVHQCSELLDYLLLPSETESSLKGPRQIAITAHKLKSASMEKMVVEFCVSHLDQAVQQLEDHQANRGSPLSHEMLVPITILCAVSEQLSWSNKSEAMEQLWPSSDKLVRQLSSLVANPACDQLLVDLVLENLAPSLPALEPPLGAITISPLVKHFSRALVDRREAASEKMNNAMEIDDEFDSQGTGQVAKHDTVDFPRELLAAERSLQSSRASIAAKLSLLASVLEANDASSVPPKFVDHIVSLPAVDFLSCRTTILEILSSKLQLTPKDCDTLLGYAADELLSIYDHERSEVAMGFAAELLAGTVALWSDVDSEAHELGTDLYRWLLKPINASAASAVVLVEASDLFCKLLKVRPDYSGESQVLAARSDLLGILQRGNVQVKYHVIGSLPQIFGLYSIDAHEDIFDSVHENLPGGDSTIEEMALRLLGYTRLGAGWHSLLRRCVYHIFETVGLVPESCKHAERCTAWLSKELGLEDSRVLFRIFAPQLIHTWVNSDQKLADIPYSAFGYDNLTSLVRDVQGEVYSQLAMFGKRDEINFLVGRLQVAEIDLAVASLPKTAAYTISYDTIPHKNDESREHREPALKQLLGDNRWKTLIGQQFPCIVAITFYTMWMRDSMEKHIEKHSEFQPFAPFLKEMQELSSSDTILPDDQQPAFRSKFIFDQLKRISRRADFNEVSFWTPDCFTYILRYLLSKIHPALGSLHACSMIRKIRFVIALAGPTAWLGYPLQISVSSLRPYLADRHCVQDTIGILQYLFKHGRSYLLSDLLCLAGNAIPILLSLNSFLSSSHDNNIAAQKATEFQQWFKSYIESCIQEIGKDKEKRDVLKLFRSMATSAGEMRACGNATAATHESELLMALLKDSSNQKKVLPDPTRDLAFDFLFRNFEPPPSFREDVLGKAAIASAYSLEVWNSSQRAKDSRAYLLWAAKVLGRSYSTSGEVKEAIRRTARSSNGVNIARDTKDKSSRILIAMHLYDLLLGDEPYKAGLAEQTLRAILTLDRDHQEILPEIGIPIPLVVIESLTMNTAYRIPLSQPEPTCSLEENLVPHEPKKLSSWIADLCISLATCGHGDGMVEFLPRLLSKVHSSAEELFPYIVHMVLEREFDGDQSIKKTISNGFGAWFERCTKADVPQIKAILRAILYLRTREFPTERTMADRVQWLDIDYQKAAEAAVTCGMYRTALLLAECHSDQPIQTSRRSSVMPQQQTIPLELQMSIYRNLEEPDSFYAVEQEAGLSSVLDRLDYESDGLKGLLFHGAQMDSHLRMSNSISMADSGKIVKDLTMLNLNSLTHSLVVNDKFRGSGSNIDHALEAAQKLEQWDIKVPASKRSGASALYRVFQGLHNSNDLATVRKHLDQSFIETIEACSGLNASAKTLHDSFRTMAALNEIDEIMSSRSEKELDDTLDVIFRRTKWFTQARVEDFRPIISSREMMLSLMSKQSSLQSIVKTDPYDLRFFQKEALEHSVDIFRRHGALQESLTAATYLVHLVEPCRKLGLETEFDAKFQVALVLWDQGEKTTSVRLLQQLEQKSRDSRERHNDRAKLLTTLGIYTSEARLKKPDEIVGQFMTPAIKALRNKTGKDEGRAYHAFAAFCDQQLQNQDLIDDYNRMRTLAERREAEASEYERLVKAEKSSSKKERLKREGRKARQWFQMDMAEAKRLGDNRLKFLCEGLENYLLALQASDEHDKDVFRMFSLWLEYSDLQLANTAVGDHIDGVPKGKFVVLMNQLSSKLLAEASQFQTILSNLVARICANHPYHGMNHIYSGSKGTGKDEGAKLRAAAATDIAHRLQGDPEANKYWSKIYRANEYYNAMAWMKEKEFRTGKDYSMGKYRVSAKMMSTIPTLKIPPITLHMPVLAHLVDYAQQPYIVNFKPVMGIANGLSQPKVVTAQASDGRSYKQLYKSGNDDLRQDAIMEQVFEHVSQLLGSHPATRLRNLQIRTYRVVPLSTQTGVIEFVQNTLPVMSYLETAHPAYYPKDWKQSKCREVVSTISAHTHEERTREYRRVCKSFHPVLRYFFLERFADPDDWFEKRLAYSRSTAAISILGHVLGLGDRHCHNILLDQGSGEVVHIDLGVAFEAGRVLPVPEVVPFRLTRDIVDAMGATGVEGVFRRCCELTLDTLRDERDSIMTILNVLRYDPLYSWSISPLKAKKMQEADEAAAAAADPANNGEEEEEDEQQILRVASRKTAADDDDDAVGEAGRALSVVERKLTKALSSAATVAELIQQATDERNLAVLYAGWSAWC
ncbi:hypothetical protein HDK77DRAFT_410026 [Phyllosticta capitalensis]